MKVPTYAVAVYAYEFARSNCKSGVEFVVTIIGLHQFHGQLDDVGHCPGITQIT